MSPEPASIGAMMKEVLTAPVAPQLYGIDADRAQVFILASGAAQVGMYGCLAVLVDVPGLGRRRAVAGAFLLGAASCGAALWPPAPPNAPLARFAGAMTALRVFSGCAFTTMFIYAGAPRAPRPVAAPRDLHQLRAQEGLGEWGAGAAPREPRAARAEASAARATAGELFPSVVRASAVAFCNTFGRAASMLAPILTTAALRASPAALLLALAAACLVAVLAACLFARSRPRPARCRFPPCV